MSQVGSAFGTLMHRQSAYHVIIIVIIYILVIFPYQRGVICIDKRVISGGIVNIWSAYKKSCPYWNLERFYRYRPSV